MIPKVIHYCWYGRSKLSSTIRMCIDSWKRWCPDYQIKEWNEDNTPMDIPWIHDAYRHQKYAFVADYMRFFILYNEGGIYMDTDMLLVRNLDDFLEHSIFLGREDQYNVSFGIVGSSKGSSFCKKCVEYYDEMSFDLVHPPIITRLLTPKLFEYGLVEKDETQYLSNGLAVYESAFFYPIHYTQQFEMKDVLSYAKEDTYGIHLWNKSWTDEFELLEANQWKLGFMLVRQLIRRTPLLPLSYWKKIVKYLGRYLGLWKR